MGNILKTVSRVMGYPACHTKQCCHLQIGKKHLAWCFVGVPYDESKQAMTI